jgi:hypothetical protein
VQRAFLGRRWCSTLATDDGGLEWQGRLRLAGGNGTAAFGRVRERGERKGDAVRTAHSAEDKLEAVRSA